MKRESVALRHVALTHQADCDILARACNGDPEAFSEVYRRYRTRIYGFCLARLRSRDLAEDATQETFVRFLSSDTSSVTSIKSWLFTVARNVCTDMWRRSQRGALPVSDIEAAGCGRSGDVAEQVRIAQDTRNGLLALRRMRTRYRVALILREIHGLAVSEIAESMGIREGTAHTLISRARDAFARSYAELSGRPEACMDALALMFEREGRVLTSADADRLEAHLSECQWCREQARASPGSQLACLLPLLLAKRSGTRDLWGRIALALRPLPEPLRDVGLLADTANNLTTRVVVPLLVTASVAIGALAPVGPVDILAPYVPESRSAGSTTSQPGTAQDKGHEPSASGTPLSSNPDGLLAPDDGVFEPTRAGETQAGPTEQPGTGTQGTRAGTSTGGSPDLPQGGDSPGQPASPPGTATQSGGTQSGDARSGGTEVPAQQQGPGSDPSGSGFSDAPSGAAPGSTSGDPSGTAHADPS